MESNLPVIHHNGASSTAKSDACRSRQNGVTFPLHGSYYRQKWGGAPDHERYEVPFDNILFNHEVGGKGKLIDFAESGAGEAEVKGVGTVPWPEPEAVPPRILCYTVALDDAGKSSHRQQARLMAVSLLKTGFPGDIKIIHNGDTELFPHGRRGVEEIRVDLPGTAHERYGAKYVARRFLNAKDYDWVLFLDCDCMAMGSLLHWFAGPWDIRFVAERGMPINLGQFNACLKPGEMTGLKQDGVNSGTFIVRAIHYQKLMQQWERIDRREPLRSKGAWDQPAWNRLLLDTKCSTTPLPDGQVGLYFQNRNLTAQMRNCMVHFAGVDTEERLMLMQMAYVGRFHSGTNTPLMEVLEG